LQGELDEKPAGDSDTAEDPTAQLLWLYLRVLFAHQNYYLSLIGRLD